MPGDKSISHRYAMLAALAEGVSTFENFSDSEDCAATRRCLAALGVPIAQDQTRVVIKGCGRNGLRPATAALYAGNSGTTLRLLAGILAGQRFESALTGDASLQRRPMGRIIEPLRQMGAEIEADGGNCAPLRIRGGPLKGIDYTLPVASAQVKSCVLLASLFAEGTTRVIEPAPTRDHTERALESFGIEVACRDRWVEVKRPAALHAVQGRVPGDLSSAAFFMVAALLLPGSDITLPGLGLNPTRLGLVRWLQSHGARIEVETGAAVNGEPVGAIRVRYRREFLEADTLTICGDHVPNVIDEIPILAVLGSQLRGGLIIRDAAELRVKESDRIARIVENLQTMSAMVVEQPDGMIISGAQALHGARIATFGDHRIAMAFTIAGLVAQGVTSLDDPACVRVSFPDFFTTLEHALSFGND